MEGSFGSLSLPMIGLLVLLVAVALGVVGALLLRRMGTAWRVGRLLSVAPERSLADAAALARSGERAYVRLHGRIDSDEEFPGEDERPLVYRRRRLQRRAERDGWRTFDDERLSVAFGLAERGERVAIDADALGDGLVVVPRIAEGAARDLRPEDASGPLPGLPPETPVRLRLEQVSTVDHATAAGVPRLADDDESAIVLGPGLGRPLILTTLHPDEAMRVLAAEHRASLLSGVVLVLAALAIGFLGFVLVILGL